MASPHVHSDDPECPHPGCGHRMEWIDFKLGLFGDPERIDQPLAMPWWGRTGFVGRCPACHGWVRFTTLRMEAVDAEAAASSPRLPEAWESIAQFA